MYVCACVSVNLAKKILSHEETKTDFLYITVTVVVIIIITNVVYLYRGKTMKNLSNFFLCVSICKCNARNV